MSKGDREELLNSLANKFGIKVEDINKKKQPLHIEIVRDNFNQIVSTLKVYELKQVQLEEEIKQLKNNNNLANDNNSNDNS